MTSFLSRGGVGAAKTDTAELELGGKRRREREREEGREEGRKEGRESRRRRRTRTRGATRMRRRRRKVRMRTRRCRRSVLWDWRRKEGGTGPFSTLE